MDLPQSFLGKRERDEDPIDNTQDHPLKRLVRLPIKDNTSIPSLPVDQDAADSRTKDSHAPLNVVVKEEDVSEEAKPLRDDSVENLPACLVNDKEFDQLIPRLEQIGIQGVEIFDSFDFKNERVEGFRPNAVQASRFPEFRRPEVGLFGDTAAGNLASAFV